MIEYQIKNNSLTGMIQAINECTLGKDVLLIKSILKSYSLNDFGNILSNQLGFKNDDRQLNLDNSIERSIWWPIIYDQRRDNVYTHSKTRQPLHSDSAWFSEPAEMVFLAVERQAKTGGETTIYTLERLLNDLEKEDNTLLSDLQSVKVKINKEISGKYHNETTIIKNEDSIYWNYYRTEKKEKTTKLMCDKFFNFLEKKERTNSVEILRGESSDIICFNDTKLLHGRLKFKARKKGDRLLHQSMWFINNL
tara:strand:- start:7975 stop:8727 length:753 start_codon:yes stop_codon:yes gene_type:complete